MNMDKAQALEMEHLDQVSGGTWKEYNELHDILISGQDTCNAKKVWRSYKTHFDDEDSVVDYLREELGIKANLHGDVKSYFFGGTPAEYTEMKTGKALSHGEVVNRLKAHVKKLGVY